MRPGTTQDCRRAIGLWTLGIALAGLSGCAAVEQAFEPRPPHPPYPTRPVTITARPTTIPANEPTLAVPSVSRPVTTAQSQSTLWGGPGPVASRSRAVNTNAVRRFPATGAGIYGGMPEIAMATGDPNEQMVLDGTESLSRATFAGEGGDFDPCVSPDGRWLVFASTQHRPTADIYIKSVTGRTVTQLTADPAQDVMPSISPDGRRVAFASNRSGSWNIYIVPVTGGQPVQLTADDGQDLHPSWSPDGARIVFCRQRETSARWEMWVTKVDQPAVSEFIGYGMFPSWCPMAATGMEGRDKILFQRSRERGDRAFSVWTVDYKPGDTSSPTEIITSTSAATINPAWSPDGQWIVFATVPKTARDQAGGPTTAMLADLWISAVDGSGHVNLTGGRYVNLTPTWGADGRIYFVSDRGGQDNIWSIGTEKAVAAARPQAPIAARPAPTRAGTGRPAEPGVANVPERER